MKFSQIPNILTIIRIIMVVPIIISILRHDYTTATILFFIAGITDMLDGFIAKRYDYQSYFGSVIDPLADKILLVSMFLAMYINDLLPLWFFIIVLFRDVMIIAGVVGYFLDKQIKESLTPSNISKINTFIQITLVIFILIAEIYPQIQMFKTEFIIIAATTTILSGADYIWLWLKQFIIQVKK